MYLDVKVMCNFYSDITPISKCTILILFKYPSKCGRAIDREYSHCDETILESYR